MANAVFAIVEIEEGAHQLIVFLLVPQILVICLFL